MFLRFRELLGKILDAHEKYDGVRQKRAIADRNIATVDELLLNLDENGQQKCQKRIDFLMNRYPLVHPGARSSILICALLDCECDF
jgi:hypothetical protein